MDRVRCQPVLVLGISLALAVSSSAYAQRTTGEISGTVMDSTNAVLPGATVVAVCSDTNLTRTVVTDTQGGFSIPELPVCVYRVRAELQGFKTVTRDAPVTPNAVAKTDFKLEVGTGVAAHRVLRQVEQPNRQRPDRINAAQRP
jgi:hypothetical protein